MIEQKLCSALDFAHRVWVMGHGQVIVACTLADLKARDDIRHEWLKF